MPRSKTTTLFCSVRPKSWSRERLLTPSTRISYSLPMQRWLLSALSSFCNEMSSSRRWIFVSSGTSSGRWREAYVPGRSLYLNMNEES